MNYAIPHKCKYCGQVETRSKTWKEITCFECRKKTSKLQILDKRSKKK